MKVLMVCLGNICRSPIAQGVLEKKISERNLSHWFVDSAGTSGWHDGEKPDPRAIKTSYQYGVNISSQISRKITKKDLVVFDHILAMDTSNYNDIIKMCDTDEQKMKVKMLMNYRYENQNRSVPDPYYDGRFDEVFELLNESLDYFLDSILVQENI